MTGADTPPRTRQLTLGVWCALVAASIGAFWPLFGFDPQADVARAVGGLEGALFDPSGEDPRLIGFLAFWMLLTRRGRVAAAWRAGAGRPALATGLFAGAVAVQAWAAHVGAPDLQIHALQLFVLGGGALLGGTEGLRAVRLPVLFLFLAMPIPAALLNAVLLPLQLATVQICSALLRLVGMEVHGFGDQILTHRGIFHVIESCSGIRLVQTLVMASVVYAELFGRRAGRTLLLIALAPVVGIAVNLARILSIVFNPWASISSVHTTQGVAMVVVGVLAIAAIDRVLAHRWPQPTREAPGSEPLLERRPDARVAAIGVAIAALIAANAWVPRWVDDAKPVSISLLPREIAGRPSGGESADLVFLGSTHFTYRVDRSYFPVEPAADAGGRPLRLFFATDDHTNRRGSALSGKTAYPGRAWQRRAVAPDELADGTPVEVALFAHPQSGGRISVHWREGFGSPAYEALRAWSGIDRSRFRRTERGLVWRVSAALDDPNDAGAVHRELLRFAQAARNAWLATETNARAGE